MKRREVVGRGGSESQQALAEQVDRLLRQLERLTRENAVSELRQAMQAAQAAAEAMRRGAAEGNAEQSRIALEHLREARRLLNEGRAGGLARGIDQALRQAESLSRRQDDIRRALKEGTDEETSNAAVKDALEHKQQMISDVRTLDSRLNQLTDEAKAAKLRTSRALNNARQALRAVDLSERIQRSQQILRRDSTASTTDLETGIARTLDSVRDKIGTARAIAAESGQTRERSLEALRTLVRSQGVVQQSLRTEARGQRGPQSGTAQGSTDRGGIATDGSADWGHHGSWNDPQMADVRRSFVEGARQLDSLRQNINTVRRDSGDIEAVIEGLRALAESSAGVEDLAAHHAQLLAALKEIEWQLRNEDSGGEDVKLVATERVEPGASYRTLVDEYYRRLSEEAGRRR